MSTNRYPSRLRRSAGSHVPQQSTNLFSHAHINNNGGTIIAKSGSWTSFNNHYAPQIPGAREKLQALVVYDAIHTGNVRADPLECHPNTRQAIMEDIIAWVEDEGWSGCILWLRGPAGIGKSAIAKTTAGRLDQENSRAKVAGSFFFFGGDPKRNSLSNFVPTIAYRLAVTIEEVGRKIYTVIKRDPGVLNADVAVQWRKLVVETVLAVADLPPAVIIIDGLDECGREKDQRMLLDLVTSCGAYFPIAFFFF
ncbi:hypothetical protein AX16_010006, partial [Volvariella volvacea WC 439]